MCQLKRRLHQVTRFGIALTVALTAVSCGPNNNDKELPLDAGEYEGTVEPSQGTPDPRPDIVLVVADDMRWDITSGEGHPYVTTPNLDAFATDAAKMNNAFVPMALCSPSRATILTGREPHLASAPGIAWRNNSFLQTQRTFAEDLQLAGYKTAYIGKWHLGDGSKPKRGFDHWESFDWLGDFFNPVVHVNGEPRQFNGYADDVLSARADLFLEAHAYSDKPIFLMIGLKAPHLQFEHPARHDNAFDDVSIPKPDSYEEDFNVSGKLQAVKDWLGIETFHCGLKCFNNDWDTYIKKHYRAILGLDDSVGTLRAATRYRGKTDNTLFIYTSDNGYTLGEHGLTEKHMIYEEPVRVPFLVDFPGRNDRGLRFDGLVSTLDIAPTALDYAGVEIPSRMSGRSLKPLADAAEEESGVIVDAVAWRDEIFLSYTGWQVGVRTDRYKYIEALNEPGHFELYDLETDPSELQSVHDQSAYADILLAMQERLKRVTDNNQWSVRSRYPLRKVLVSSPIARKDVDGVARAVSLDGIPQVGTNDANGLSWQMVNRDDDGFDLGTDIPTDSSVLVAVPIQRQVDWDPHTKVFIGSPWQAVMYVGGEPLWDNFEKRPIDYPNPPLEAAITLMVMRFDGEGSMKMAMGVEVPENTITLPLESLLLSSDP